MPDAQTSLLSQIESDLVGGQPVADILRKLIILAGQADLSDVRIWASQELRGYGRGQPTPDYRTVRAVIQVDYLVGTTQVSRHTVSPEWFPDEVREDITDDVDLRQGIGEIQSMVSAGSNNGSMSFSKPGSTALARLVFLKSSQRTRVTNIYWTVSIAALEGIIDQAKTRLAELLGELRAATPRGQDVPTAQGASNAVNIVLNGRGHSVSVANGITGAAAAREDDKKAGRRFWTLGKSLGATAVGLATILGTAITWWQSQNAFQP